MDGAEKKFPQENTQSKEPPFGIRNPANRPQDEDTFEPETLDSATPQPPEEYPVVFHCKIVTADLLRDPLRPHNISAVIFLPLNCTINTLTAKLQHHLQNNCFTVDGLPQCESFEPLWVYIRWSPDARDTAAIPFGLICRDNELAATLVAMMSRGWRDHFVVHVKGKLAPLPTFPGVELDHEVQDLFPKPKCNECKRLGTSCSTGTPGVSRCGMCVMQGQACVFSVPADDSTDMAGGDFGDAEGG